ncbi:MAG: acyl-CoA dehydrogenase family protein [Thermoleophilaceae bacterium]
MEFELTSRHEEWRAHCHSFARDELRPVADRHDRDGMFPWDALRAARAAGLYDEQLLRRIGEDPAGLFAPILFEELHWGCAGIAQAIGLATGVAAMLATQGTPEQAARLLPRCYAGVDGDVSVPAYALTEPEAGSDVSSLRTRARRDGDGWVLDGAKSMIAGGGIAAFTLVVASVEPELRSRGQATFVVERGADGLSTGTPHETLGLRAQNVADLALDGCRVGADALLGGEDALEARLERARERGPGGPATRPAGSAAGELTRPLFAAGALGILRAALEWTLEWLAAARRDSGDGASAEAGAAAGAVAEIAAQLEGARLLVWRTTWMARQGQPLRRAEGSMAKLAAARLAMRGLLTLMDVVGPAAGDAECPLGKWLRDARAFAILEGTDEIQESIVMRRLLAEVETPA